MFTLLDTKEHDQSFLFFSSVHKCTFELDDNVNNLHFSTSIVFYKNPEIIQKSILFSV